MAEESSLAKVFEGREDNVIALAKATRQRDPEGFATALTELVGTAVSSVPLVGKLLAEGTRALFARSAYARMQAEIIAVGAELDEAERTRQTARLVAQLVGHALAALGEEQAALQAGIRRLDERFDDFQASFRLAAATLRVEQTVVDEGATGVRIRGESQRDVEIKQVRVTGKGTTGVEL